ncbi:Uncharacterised protein [Shigella sonnei]|nr:Uncharacterised protein [Shigella sonnei]
MRKLKMKLCALMLPLVVVGCTSKPADDDADATGRGTGVYPHSVH